MRKHFKVIMLLVLIVIFSVNIIEAKVLNDVLVTASPDFIIDSQYGWTYKFIRGVTYAEPFGFITRSEDLWKTYESGGKETNEDLNGNEWEVLRLDSDSQKGKVGMIYHKVGTYKGKYVSIKITLMDWEKLGPSGTTNEGRLATPCIYFEKNNINVLTGYDPIVYKPQWRIQFFYDEDLSVPIDIKGYVTVKDLDNEEYIITNFDEFEKAIITNNTNLVYSDENGINSVRVGNKPGDVAFQTWDEENWITFIFDTSKMTGKGINFLYSDTKKEKNAEKTEITNNMKRYYQWMLEAGSISGFNTPEIYKSCDKNAITQGDSLKYTLSFHVPAQPKAFKYTSLGVTDEVENCLDIKSVKVFDETKADVTGKFDITTNNNNVAVNAKADTLTADDFYNKNYFIEIDTKLKDNPELKNQIKNGKYKFSNDSKITTNRGTNTSNETETEIYYKIITEIVNGTIDPNVDHVTPTTDKSISFVPNPGYHVTSITVDGKDVDVKDYDKGGKYDFTNINANHKISVVCERIISKIIVKYVDIDTGNELIDQKVVEGTVGDEYLTKEEEIANYDLVKDKYPENAKGTMTEEDITVVYYYKTRVVPPDTSDINVPLFVTIFIVCIIAAIILVRKKFMKNK